VVLRPPTRVSQKRPHQTLVQRLQRNNVLSIRKDDAADSYRAMLRMVSRTTANASCPTSLPVSAFTLA
jgi:hypothetical protein